METLIIYSSIYHGNTEKIAIAMGETLNAKTIKTADAKSEDLNRFDLVGFGSGVYAMRMDGELIHFVEELPRIEGKKAFVFTTSGMGRDFSGSMANILIKKGFDIIGRFDCKGFDDWGPLKLKGGVNKGKPDGTDITAAKEFARGLFLQA